MTGDGAVPMMTTLVVVGAGAAGIPAALAALEEGAHVILIEKATRVGGMLWASGAVTSGAESELQRARGITDSAQAHYDEVFRAGRGRADPTLLRLATDEAGRTIDWLVTLGTPFTADSPMVHGLADEHEQYATPRSYLLDAPDALGPYRGPVLAQVLERALRSWLGSDLLRLMTDTTVVDLLAADGGVIGVRVIADGQPYEIRADAVLLTTGGYAANQDLLRRFHPDFDHLVTSGLGHASGDGLVLAETLGGQVVNTDLVIPMMGAVADPNRPGFRLGDAMLTVGRPPATSGDIWINKLGRRFVAEDTLSPDVRERAILAQPGAVMYAVFDEPMRVGLTDEVGRWTAHHLGDPPSPRLVRSAQSVRDLAQRIGVDPEALEDTVGRYNSAQNGPDDFGRKAMPAPVLRPPFHAVATASTLLITFAGLRVDSELRVLGPDGVPIPNLYAAGELLGGGQIQGDAFSSGMSVTPAIAFGRIAARRAVRAARGACSPHDDDRSTV